MLIGVRLKTSFLFALISQTSPTVLGNSCELAKMDTLEEARLSIARDSKVLGRDGKERPQKEKRKLEPVGKSRKREKSCADCEEQCENSEFTNPQCKRDVTREERCKRSECCSTSKKGSLNRHMINTGEMPFQCDMCLFCVSEVCPQ